MKYLLILFSIFLASCSNYDVKTLNKNDTIVAFGDSLTFGYGASTNKSYPSVLSKISGYRVINQGINGNTTKDGLERIKSVIQEHNPKLVLLGLGGNDLLRKYNQEEIEKNIVQMIQILKSQNIQVVLLPSPQPSLFGAIGHLNDAEFYSKIADNQNIPIIEDIYSEPLSDPKLKSDLIHLNDNGYEIVAKTIYNFLLDKQFLINY